MHPFDSIAHQMDALGVQSFGADLQGGRIHWMDGSNAVVAHGRCKAILSFAATNNSYLWLSAHSQYQGVPKVMKPEGAEGYREGVTEAEARAVAVEAAIADGAAYMYAAPMGGGGFVYLAVHDLAFGPLTLSPEEQLHKTRAAMQYVVHKVDALLSIAARPDFDTVLYAFLRDMEAQYRYVLKGLPAAAVVQGFVERIAPCLEDGQEAVVRALGQVRVEANAMLSAMG
jgi:hypothetical protein